ncbi:MULTISPECIES: hypothetical protein [Vibrio]|nr:MULTISPECIES: hypothetical protein [Vibrio]EEX38982.1 hypothetical protein VFA_004258 [Vibrio furnissii CIP 102972]WHR50162.1 hypothetical protein O8413_08730 [Vibrio furnissii]WJG25693.1 hypothetical protein QSU96_13140 [Vibrio furnissii]SUP46466.1 glutamate-1-semialdehyde aminotransferase [Vibrio furnissii]
MGCCDNDKGCEQTSSKRRRIPWLGVVIAILVILVAVNWQA